MYTAYKFRMYPDDEQKIEELFMPIRIFIMQLKSVSIFWNSTALFNLLGSFIPNMIVIF